MPPNVSTAAIQSADLDSHVAAQKPLQSLSKSSTKPAPSNAGSVLWLSILAGAIGVYIASQTVWQPYIATWAFVRRDGLHNPMIPVVATLCYVLMVAIGPKIMANRAPLDLKTIVIGHNYILSAGSLVMMSAIGVEVAKFLFQPNGLEAAACDSAVAHPSTQLYFWYFVFYLSKMYEFIDTAILIARKKPLIFLHVYHHIITLWLCWVCLDDLLSIQWLCTIANTFIHVMMYYFYACQALKINVWWKRHLTSMQITQFVLDIAINVSWAYYTLNGVKCSGSWFGFWFGMGVIASFLGLFINFYIKSYLKPKAPAKTD